MSENNLTESELIQLGYEESSIEDDHTIWCESCASSGIWTEATREVFNAELCTECFYEVTDGMK
tara:strand:- start:1615 stop:1806 length:192 start_codon:yes stop_codon:yes gene_type:complete